MVKSVTLGLRVFLKYQTDFLEDGISAVNHFLETKTHGVEMAYSARTVSQGYRKRLAELGDRSFSDLCFHLPVTVL